MAEAAEVMLSDLLAADGHLRLRWLTKEPPAERNFRMRQRGLVHDDNAPIVLWTSRGITLQSLETVDAIYADLAVAAPALGALMEQSVTVYLATPDAGLLDVATRDPAPLTYVESYLAGLALGQALMEVGRVAGQEALRRALAETGSALPFSVHRISD